MKLEADSVIDICERIIDDELRAMGDPTEKHHFASPLRSVSLSLLGVFGVCRDLGIFAGHVAESAARTAPAAVAALFRVVSTEMARRSRPTDRPG